MITKVSFGSLLNGPVPARCSSLPDAATLKRSLDEFARATDKIAAEREDMNAGARLKKAVQARLQHRSAASNRITAEDEDFAERLKKAVEERSGKKRRKEQAEEERSRYKPFKQRPHTKSD